MTRNKVDKSKKAVIEALEESVGIVTIACKEAQVARGTFYKWYNNDDKFKQAVDDIQEVTLDFVESKLLNNIKNGDTTAIIFYLKTKGKQRGYIERPEDMYILEKTPDQITIEIVHKEMTDEDIEEAKLIE